MSYNSHYASLAANRSVVDIADLTNMSFSASISTNRGESNACFYQISIIKPPLEGNIAKKTQKMAEVIE